MKKLVVTESQLTKIIQKAVEKKLNEDITGEFSVEPNVSKTPRETELENLFGSYSGEIPADIVRYMRKNPRLIMQRLYDMYGDKMYDYMKDSSKPSKPEGDDIMIDDFIVSEGSADENGDGTISPEELYRHFDLDNDGVVTMADYAAHVDFHCENPELLQQARESDEYFSKMEQDRQPFVDFFSMGDMVMEQEDEEEEIIKYPVDDFNFELSDSDMMDIYDHKGPVRRFRGSIYIDDLVPETDDKEYDREVAKRMMEYYRKQIKNSESYVGGVGFKQRSLIEPFDNMDF